MLRVLTGFRGSIRILRILPVLAVFCVSVLKNATSSAVSTAHHAASIRSSFGRDHVPRIYCQYYF